MFLLIVLLGCNSRYQDHLDECSRHFKNIVSMQNDISKMDQTYSEISDLRDRGLIGKTKYVMAKNIISDRKRMLESDIEDEYSDMYAIRCFD